MPDICLYCQVHQPHRLRPYRLFDIGTDTAYFDEDANRAILRKVADKCYLPANRLLRRLIEEGDGDFRLALSMSGTLLEQLEAWHPEALASFRDLVRTGRVELLAETYYHSLSALTDTEEFVTQVRMHEALVERLFGVRPSVFRNTELIYHDGLAETVADLGFRAMLVEGADQSLKWRSPNYVYAAPAAPGLRLLPRNYRLSDDVGFRFSNRSWHGWPLTAERYAAWIAASGGDSVHLFLDYETFGEHQWADTGIFDFVAALPRACRDRGLRFVQPSTLAERPPVGDLDFPNPTSWADVDRGVTAWLGNDLQRAAHQRLYRLREPILAFGDPTLMAQWRRLTTSDHFYYMCTKWAEDGDVHRYFSPHASPYDAFIAFMNVMQDFEQSFATTTAGLPPHLRAPGLAEMACVV